jgi:hypothetical protein
MKKKQSEVNSDNFEPMSELERRLKDVDVSELPDSFRLFGDYSGVDDDDEELDDEDDEEFNMYGMGVDDNNYEKEDIIDTSNHDGGNDEEELDDEPNEEDDSDFVDDDEETEKAAKEYIEEKLRSALEPLKEIIDWLEDDAKNVLVDEHKYEKHLDKIDKAYIELLKVLRHV